MDTTKFKAGAEFAALTYRTKKIGLHDEEDALLQLLRDEKRYISTVKNDIGEMDKIIDNLRTTMDHAKRLHIDATSLQYAITCFEEQAQKLHYKLHKTIESYEAKGKELSEVRHEIMARLKET